MTDDTEERRRRLHALEVGLRGLQELADETGMETTSVLLRMAMIDVRTELGPDNPLAPR